MKDSSSVFLVILVLLVTLIGGAAGFYLKKRVKLELYDVQDWSYIEILPDVDIVLASDAIEDEQDFATSCYRLEDPSRIGGSR